MEKITVIKAAKRHDLWDYKTNKPIEDNTPIGYVLYTEGAIPESYIKWIPNKIFDRRKYPDLYKLFGKDRLPNELELECFIKKNHDLWYQKNKNNKYSLTFILMNVIFILLLIIIYFGK